MMTCKNCGAQIADNAAFCNVCGAPVAAPVPPMQQPEVSAVPEQQVQPEVNTAPVQPEMNVASGQFTQPMNDGMQFQNGQQMNGGAQFQNGQQMTNGMPYQNNQMGYNPYAYQNAMPAKNKKTGLIIGIILAAIVIVAAVLIIKLCFGNNNSYEAAVKKFVKGIEKHDLSMMVETFPEPIRDEMKDDMLYWYDDEEEFWEDFDESVEYYCGSNVRYSYKIEEAERFDSEDMEDIEDELYFDYDYRCDVTDAYALEVVLTAKGSEGRDTSYFDFTAVKIKGKWYLIMDLY